MAFNPEDNSFVKQSLSETLTGTSTSSRLVPKPSLGRARKLLNPKDMASRKAKADDESGGILKTLGLTPSSRKNLLSPDKHPIPPDWEQVRVPSHSETYSNHHPSEPKTPKLHQPQPSSLPQKQPTEQSQDPMKSIKLDSNSTPSKHQPQVSSDPLTRRHSSQMINESSIIVNLRRQLAESQKSREELSTKCSKLERELNELKGNDSNNRVMGDGKLLGTSEYQELEKQFDEQEKLLSGYQRENERSLIELEATKVKMSKMGNLLTKIYGPEWEDTISSNMNENSPGGTLKQNPTMPHRGGIYSTPLKTNPTTIPSSPSDKLSLQLAQVQLLVQGMERRLVSREAELEDLHKLSKLEHLSLQESLGKIVNGPPQSAISSRNK